MATAISRRGCLSGAAPVATGRAASGQSRPSSIGWLVLAAVMACCAAPPAEAQPASDRQAVYAAREAELQRAIDARPGDAQALVELAAFYLEPLAPRDVEAADGVRRRVMVPLKNEWIVEGIKEIYDPAGKSKWSLATAVYHHWLGELEQAAGSATAALRADPTSLDALDFLVDVTRGTRTKDKHAYFKGILDRWAGGDTSPVVPKPRGMGPRR